MSVLLVMVIMLLVPRAATARHRPRAPQSCFGPTEPARPVAVERTFVFADVVGFTAFAQEHGDGEAARVATGLHWAARRSLRGDTALVKTLGDGVMLAAVDAAAATASAVALVGHVDDDPLLPPVAVGVHRGVAVELDGDYYGRAVNLAARLAEVAHPGQVLCTGAVAAATGGAPEAAPAGVARVKGMADGVVLYEVRTRERTGGGR